MWLNNKLHTWVVTVLVLHPYGALVVMVFVALVFDFAHPWDSLLRRLPGCRRAQDGFLLWRVRHHLVFPYGAPPELEEAIYAARREEVEERAKLEKAQKVAAFRERMKTRSLPYEAYADIEWTIGPGTCERCEVYVPHAHALVRDRDSGGPWLCDECYASSGGMSE
jgi:hypothetical protein